MARVATAITQIVLGWYLDPAVFGLYGVGLGILSLTAIMRAGGSATYLPSMRPEEFRKESGRLFGWGLLCVTLGAVITSGVAIPAAEWQLDPALAWVLWTLAARNLIQVVSLQARMRMLVDLRFRELAALDTVNSIGKLALSWLLAIWLGHTPMAALALAIPYAVAPLIELAYCLPASGITLQELTPRPREIWRTAKELRWALALAIAVSINSQTNIIAMRAIIPIAAVGLIYWAYQLASQPMTMLASGLTNVFAPTMARERGNPKMEQDTMHRVFAGSMLLVPFIFFGAFTLFGPAEALIYQGRWAAATWPLLFLSIGFCYVTVSYVLNGPLTGLRQFKTLAGFEAVRAVGLIGGTAIGCQACAFWGLELDHRAPADSLPTQDLLLAVVLISAFTGIGMAITAILQLWYIMRRFGLSRTRIARTLLFGPFVALLTLIASKSIADSLAHSVSQSVDVGDIAPRTVELLRLVVSGTVFGVATVVIVRFLAEETLSRAIDVLPAKLRGPVRRAMAL